MDLQRAPGPVAPTTCDNNPTTCRGNDKSAAHDIPPCSLPAHARLPINRCNLPSSILGGLTFQRFPAPLYIDGIRELHSDFFRRLDAEPDADARVDVFRDYLTVRFCLEQLEEAGFTGQRKQKKRARATWERLIRGWSFNSDNREGAVLKAWVESRFGLVPRFHGESLRDPSSEAWLRFQEDRCRGLYGTNALEAQLDLLYTWCQYELAVRHPAVRHLTLYRGVNRIGDHEVLGKTDRGDSIILLNNLSSFTASRDRAGEFGDYILCADIPMEKILYHYGLMPDRLQGEGEFLVIGGVLEVSLST